MAPSIPNGWAIQLKARSNVAWSVQHLAGNMSIAMRPCCGQTCPRKSESQFDGRLVDCRWELLLCTIQVQDCGYLFQFSSVCFWLNSCLVMFVSESGRQHSKCAERLLNRIRMLSHARNLSSRMTLNFCRESHHAQSTSWQLYFPACSLKPPHTDTVLASEGRFRALTRIICGTEHKVKLQHRCGARLGLCRPHRPFHSHSILLSGTKRELLAVSRNCRHSLWSRKRVYQASVILNR